MGYVSKYLSKFFHNLGGFVATHPKKCVAFPVLLTLFFSVGFFNYSYIEDMQYLYTITGSQNKLDREYVRAFFPEKPSFFDPSRSLDFGRFVRVVITAKDGGTILKPEFWKELGELNEIVSAIEVDNKNMSSLCAAWNGECLPLNQFLEMEELIPAITNGTLRLSYPVMFNVKTLNAYPIPAIFGSINFTDDGHSVQSAKAAALNFIVRVENEEDNLRGREWERKVMTRLDELDSKWKHINVYRLSFFSFTNEAWATLILALPGFLFTGALAGFFAVSTTMQSDCVRSKPWLGMLGMLSAVLATVSAYGVLSFFGRPLMLMDCAIPFIVFGIGVDDTFVLIAAWRNTNCRDPVQKRLSESYSDAAVSITITTLTDMLSFVVGIFTPIPCVQLFSIAAAVGVIFVYVWHLFFFGGIMAISGFQEENNKCSMFWWLQAIPKSKLKQNEILWKRWFLTGGFDESDPKNPINESENALMVFFRDTFSSAITSKCGQALIIVTFICYLLTASYGVTQLEEGIEIDKLVRYESEMAQFIKYQRKHFSTFGIRIQIIIGVPLDYSSNETQSRVEAMLQDIYSLEYVTSEYSENWLRDYTRYIDLYKDFIDFNITNEKEFNKVYLEQYSNDGRPSHLDVKFNEDNSTIIATRYIVQSKFIGKPNALRDLVISLRHTLKKYKDLNATAFMPWFDFVDQAIVIRELTMKLVVVAALVVMAVTVFFIPSIFTSFAVFFSIASIELGVLGFMSFLDVHLDMISLVTIIACIGFSVDFSAHVSYAYISSKASNSKERVRESMYLLGLPIFQGAISTVIGVLGLLYIPAYTFGVTFKILSLVMIFAIFHGLFVLPVFFTILKPENFQNMYNRKTYSVEKGKVLRF